MSNVTLRNQFVTLRNAYNCARAEVNWAFYRVCQGPCTSQRANDYTGARTVVRSWRARRRAVAAAMAGARQDLRVRIPSRIADTPRSFVGVRKQVPQLLSCLCNHLDLLLLLLFLLFVLLHSAQLRVLA